MKKLLLLTMASLMTVFAMAMGDNSGSTKANAIDFDWDNGAIHESTTPLWYRVKLDKLYEEDNPALTLYLNNLESASVDVKMVAYVAGEERPEEYTIAPNSHKTYTANASVLVRMQQTDIYLTLNATGRILLSAKVFEQTDLDESCKTNTPLRWQTPATQDVARNAWWKVDIQKFKQTTKQDVQLTITNRGNQTANVTAGVSFDCPSTGLTSRSFTVGAGNSVTRVVPGSNLRSLNVDELYGCVTTDQPLTLQIDSVPQTATTPIFNCQVTPATKLELEQQGQTINSGLYYISVEEAKAVKNFEPEFTFFNTNAAAVKMTTFMAFECEAYSATETNYNIPAGGSEVVVFKRNMFEGLDASVHSVYLLIETEQPLVCDARLKHMREGKDCKTNIDFNWATGHQQEANTTQWYAVDMTEAKANVEDVTVYAQNMGQGKASVSVSLAFSCPYIDVQKFSHTIAAGANPIKHTFPYSFYSATSDTIWVGVETNQELKIWATTAPAAKKENVDTKCQDAIEFDWEDGKRLTANDTVWYHVDMTKVRNLEKYPTVYVHNLGESKATVYGEISFECPDSLENEHRSISVPARGTYSKELSRDLFENIKSDEVWVRVVSTQDIHIEVRFTEEAEGSSCSSAIKFNWEIGNDQAAEANLWYYVDLKEKKAGNKDLYVTVRNKDNAACNGALWIAFTCPFETQQVQKFSLKAKETKSKLLPHSTLETADDIVYFRVISNTALHFEAKDSTPADFDTIHCEDIAFQELQWNTIYQHTAGTSWYIIPKEILQQLDGIKETPELWAHNLGANSNKIKAEVAYHCPITETMMNQTKTLSPGQEVTKLVERGTMEQVMGKDSVLIRITSAEDFEFSANLVNPNTGENEMRPIIIDQLGDTTYQIAANSTLWYRIKTKDMRKDESLHGKSLHVATQNLGGKAKVQVAIFEDAAKLTDADDLLQGEGTRSVPAGKKGSKNIPAYVVHGLGDVDILVRVTTDQPLTLSTKLNDYASASVDPDQAKAKLFVPNVDYNIPADTTMWFVMCVPYMHNNFNLSVDDVITFQNLGADEAVITGTATCQANCTYAIPERTRRVAGGRSVTKSVKELANKAIQKTGINYSIMETKSSYLDSLLNRFVTKDSVEAYVRVRSSQPLLVRLNSTPAKGASCENYVSFDWEHGNVNQENKTTWYKVFFGYEQGADGKPAKDADGNIIIHQVPAGNDLRLHFDTEEWGGTPNDISVKIKELCGSDPLTELSKSMEKDTSKLISRKVLETWQSDLLIEYSSTKTSHIWAELVPQIIDHDTIVNDTMYLCPGEKYEDRFTIKAGETHIIDPNDPNTWKWETTYDSISEEDATYVLFHLFYTVLPLQQPKIIPLDQLTNIPTVKRGTVIDCAAAIDEIYNALEGARLDSTMYVGKVDSIVWMYSTDGGSSYKPVPNTVTKTEQVRLYYQILTECGDVLESDTIKNVAVDSLVVEECNYYQWKAGNDSVYKTSTRDTLSFPSNDPDSLSILVLTLKNDVVMHVAASQKYGNRLLMINRNAMNDSIRKYMPDEYEALALDSLEEAGVESLVKWYIVEDEQDQTPERAGTGYYITNPNGLGDPMPSGMYYAVVTIPSLTPGECPFILYTNLLDCRATDTSNPAPALRPSMARASEQINVVNLDPEQETIIRVYTSEGFRIGDYTVSGESSFQMKAAAERGIYLVEVNCDGMKSTLRYIVK